MPAQAHADASPRTSTAIVFLTHRMSPSVDQEMQEIAAATRGTRDLWSTAYLAPGKTEPPAVPSPWTFVPILQPDIVALGYEAKLQRVKHWRSLVFNNDLFLLSFFLQHAQYDRYWFIEYDVRYTGDWGTLLDELDESSADLLCTHVHRRQGDTLQWMHWNDLITPVPENEHVRGFLPICRVSQRFMAAVHQAYQDGWSGHYEAVWPTLAVSRGWSVEDIGGTGTFVPESRYDRFYYTARMSRGLILSTFAVWPRFSMNTNYHKGRQEGHKDILWHPVK